MVRLYMHPMVTKIQKSCTGSVQRSLEIASICTISYVAYVALVAGICLPVRMSAHVHRRRSIVRHALEQQLLIAFDDLA